MHPVIGSCPVCHQEMEVTRLHCRHCDTSLEGHFGLGRFYELSAEQLHFVEIFVRCQGRLNRIQEELRLSYPTVRNRLHDVIRALGYDVEEEEQMPVGGEMRQAVLAALAAGEISAEEATRRLRGIEVKSKT